MITVEQVLEYYRKEFPFTEGEDSPNRDRYYWLSGLLHSVSHQVLENMCFVGTSTVIWHQEQPTQ